MKNHISSGDQFNYTATEDVKAGGIVVFNKIVGVSIDAVKSGAEGVASCSGVYSVEKTKEAKIDFGQEVHVNTQSGMVSVASNPGANDVLAGYCWKDAAITDGFVDVKIH